MEPTGEDVLAVDLALIPPDWVQQRARAVNGLLAEPPDGFRFDATHLPHITLAQQFVRRAKLPTLIHRLDSILREVSPLTVCVLRVVSQESTVSFLLDRAPDLLRLHGRLMDAAQPVEEPTGAAEAFFADGEPARQSDVQWVSRYRYRSSYSKFVPHITLGIGTVPEPSASFAFLADYVGLFHLGCFCTCRLLLREWRL